MGSDPRAYLEEAHWLAGGIGWAVFPIHGKEPAHGGRGCLDATREPDGVEALWARAARRGVQVTGVGVATGAASGVWVLDIDGEEGEAALSDLVDEMEVPAGAARVWSPVQASTGRGRHLYFAEPADGVWMTVASGLRALGRVYAGIDVRGSGGYVVAPPSGHYDKAGRPTGRSYQWIDTGDDSGPGLAPEWLLSVIRGRLRGVEGSGLAWVQARGRTSSGWEGAARGRRREVVVGDDGGDSPERRYALRGLATAVARVESAGEGERHAALNRAAYRCGGWVGAGLLARGEVEAALCEAWRVAAGEGREREGLRTVAAGIDAGSAAPTPVSAVGGRRTGGER